ncbi:hypothetical protein MKK88_20660 [Methylobacterium sp. E-005]|uniref:hypothetical protein n=1 Tax=Methylobacterium sp. E-005 TaxID=2836549 RepID=UPI001FBB398F|nr:hypothetical protein [Methylobacterium sp. E-005]MCJ2088379.1 hypothetical protein [Methylobacterium sp. E-005]
MNATAQLCRGFDRDEQAAGWSDLMASSVSREAVPSPMIGPARLIRAAFEGTDMGAWANDILSRAGDGDLEAGTALDLATILLLMHRSDTALQLQNEVLGHCRHFQLQSNTPEAATRVLVIVTAGDLMANTPVDFLLDDPGFRLEYLFVLPGDNVPDPLPAHDVCIIGVAYSTANEPVLEALASAASRWDRPVINHPRNVLKTSRHGIAEALDGAEGIVVPSVIRVPQAAIATATGVLPDGWSYPVLIRPIDTHAGNALRKIAGSDDLTAYLDRSDAETYYVTQFYDYSGSDGLFRKLRIVLVDGVPFLCHMAIRDHWMIHYLNAGMSEDSAKRNAEAEAMATFDDQFAPRHRTAFAAIHNRTGLDYLILDCAETRDGRLLVFEADTGMVIHDMDPVNLYPYKRPQMHRVFAAFQNAIRMRATHTA